MATHEITSDEFIKTLDGNKIVLIDFWATWCGPCRAFGPIYEKASEDPANADIYFGKVDVDAQQRIAASEGIQAMPTLIAYKDGKAIFNHVGALLLAQLDQVIEKVRAFEV